MTTKKKILIKTAFILILISAISLISYYWGKNSASSQESNNYLENSQVLKADKSQTETPKQTSSSATPTKSTSPRLTPTPVVKTTTVNADKNLDGFRSSNNSGNTMLEIKIGRNANFVTRGLFSFDISQLPEGINIKEAKLRVFQSKIVGVPYNSGQEAKIDHLTYGDTLDANDYGLAALSSNFATISVGPRIEWKEVPVTDKLIDDIANARSRSQYRIHFRVEKTGGDEKGDFAFFESSDNTLFTGNTPQLIVNYY